MAGFWHPPPGGVRPTISMANFLKNEACIPSGPQLSDVPEISLIVLMIDSSLVNYYGVKLWMGTVCVVEKCYWVNHYTLLAFDVEKTLLK